VVDDRSGIVAGSPGGVVEPFSCSGTYLDDRGRADLMWTLRSLVRRDRVDGYEICGVVRGAEVRGHDFDALGPVSPDTAGLPLDRFGELTDCVLTGELPCQLQVGEEVFPCPVAFTLDLHEKDRRTSNLRLSCVVDDVEYAVTAHGSRTGSCSCSSACPGTCESERASRACSPTTPRRDTA
jgi:hypothetical protein